MEAYTQYYNLGIKAKTEGRFEDAKEYHLRALEINPEWDFPEAWHNAGAALLRLGQPQKARPYLEKALQVYQLKIEFEEKVGYYHYWKSATHALIKQKEKMLDHLQEAIKRHEQYALEASEEEDFNTYKEDTDFIKLIEKISTEISKRKRRGEAMLKNNFTTTEAEVYSLIQQFLKKQQLDDRNKEAMDSGQALCPQIIVSIGELDDYRWQLQVYLDESCFHLQLEEMAKSHFKKSFLIYYDDADQVKAFLTLLQLQLSQAANWMEFLYAIKQADIRVQLEWPNGTLSELNRYQAAR